MSSKYSPLITKLINNHDAWIFGSAADPENINPRDYDIFIPVNEWHTACLLIPSDFKINTLGGFKIIDDNKEVDIFTGNFNEFITRNFFKYAFHPKTNIRIIRI